MRASGDRGADETAFLIGEMRDLAERAEGKTAFLIGEKRNFLLRPTAMIIPFPLEDGRFS
jgi:hypothetical protein